MNCFYCRHEKHEEIKSQLINGQPYRRIISAYGGSLAALSAHRQHVKELLKAEGSGVRMERASDLISRITKLVGRAEKLIKAAKRSGDLRGAVAALNACTKALDLLGRVTGAISTGGIQVNVSNRMSATVTSPRDDLEEILDSVNDRERADMVSMLTNGYDAAEFARLRSLANGDVLEIEAENAPLHATEQEKCPL